MTVWATETCQAARRRVLERRRLDRRVDAERRRRLERLERDWFVRAAPAATTIQALWRGFFAREVFPDAGRLRRLRASMRASRARAKEDPSFAWTRASRSRWRRFINRGNSREVREALRTLADATALCASCARPSQNLARFARCCARFADAIDRRRTSPCSPRRTNSSSGSARTRTGPRWRCSRRGIPSRSSPNTCRCAGIDPSSWRRRRGRW